MFFCDLYNDGRIVVYMTYDGELRFYSKGVDILRNLAKGVNCKTYSINCFTTFDEVRKAGRDSDAHKMRKQRRII